jgi:uracil-DNA glycosylase family 4
VPRSPVDSRVALVLDHPTELEAKRSTWMTGKRGGASELLLQTLTAVGLNVDDLYVCSALNCRPNTAKPAMLKKGMLACTERLVEELKSQQIERVLCVGALGYSALMSSHKTLPITKHRGRWRKAFGMDVMGTIAPGLMFNDPDWFRDFAYDIQKFARGDGLQPWPNVEWWVPETYDELEEALKLLSKYDYISCDLETTGFSCIDDDVIAAGFCGLDGEDAQVVILDEWLLEDDDVWQHIADIVASDQDLVFHNAKFDLKFIKEQLLRRGLEFAPRNIHCTLMQHYTLDERPIGSKFKSHGLEALARVRYDAPDYGINIGQWLKTWADAEDELREEMRFDLHTYLALDCYYTARLHPDLWNEAMEEDERLLDLYEDLLMPGTIALVDIEHHGVLLDREMFEGINEELSAKADAIKAKLQDNLDWPDFNPNSSKQVQQLIYEDLGMPFGQRTENGKVYHSARRGKLQEGPTAAAVLKNLSERYPEHKEVIEDILEYRTYTKTIGTYVKGMLQRMDSDGRLRTNINLAGTATGRTSSSDPNLQNVPDASHIGIDIRAGFIAAPGNVYVSADYKQLEVRVAAMISEDPAMLEIFLSGRDCHQEIAYSIYHKPKAEISKYERWLAKNILFGLLYGRGYESVATGPEQEDIARHGGRRWTIEEVKTYFDSLLAEWKVFAEWQATQKHIGYTEGEIVTPTGRHRRFPFIAKHDGGHVGRASFNTPIQGTASDFTLYALIRMHELLPEGASVILIVHDELIIECREDQATEVAELLKRTMEEDTLLDSVVPFACDIEMSTGWGSKSGIDKDVINVEAAA